MLTSKNKSSWKGFKPRTAKPMARVGKKGKLNITNNAELKRRFADLEIFACELRYDGCLGNMMLGFAHAKKRRKFETDEDWMTAVLACVKCHEFLDNKCSHEEMERRVNEVIEAR